jgi:hypothetical protein
MLLGCKYFIIDESNCMSDERVSTMQNYRTVTVPYRTIVPCQCHAELSYHAEISYRVSAMQNYLTIQNYCTVSVSCRTIVPCQCHAELSYHAEISYRVRDMLNYAYSNPHFPAFTDNTDVAIFMNGLLMQ